MATTDNNEIVVNRDYTDNFSIKQTALAQLGEKYFSDINLSGLNVGVLGFTLEQIANITEDAFNTASVLITEAFPNRATIPESIYSHAALFQIDNTFAKCASCTFLMILQQEDVLKYGTTSGSITTFYLDKNTLISVEDITFTLDYDIKITVTKKQVSGAESEYLFAAQYVLDHNNSISDVNDPYLKIRKTPNGYLILQFTAHQVVRTELEDSIISNTKINYPTLEFDFEGMLAGFDIFYKSPTDSEYTQMTKKIMYTTPIKTPFCYYRLKDESTLKISFSSRDGYFQPDFNSNIKVILYTTLGAKGNFPTYNGTKIELQTNSETYEYNDSLTLAVKTMSASSGGDNHLSLEELQVVTVENYSTATELSTENDIQTYFYNYKYRYGNEMLVIKRKDDISERLFSAFLLIKNNDYIYPTNTLFLDITQPEFDYTEDDARFVLQPGHVFKYKDGSFDTVELIPNVMCYDKTELEVLMKENTFVFTNPFLISMTKSPSLIGLYQTIINKSAKLDFIYANSESFEQFISSNVNVKRGLDRNQCYNISLLLTPSTSMDPYIENLHTYENNDVRVIAAFNTVSGDECGYLELLPTKISEDDNTLVTFSADLRVNDYITSDGRIALTNAIKTDPLSTYPYVPISDMTISIYILYFDGITETNKFSNYFDDMQYYTITNKYNTASDPITLITPLNMMRSTVIFSNVTDEKGEQQVMSNISLLPMVKADLINDEENFNKFIETVSDNYTYMENSMEKLRNNTNIDIKFYNTYGKSINYYIGDNEELIDRVNISIRFKVVLTDGVDDAELKTDLQNYIKEFIENLSSSGTNDLYISNLIHGIENNFGEVHHLKFLGINDYSTDYQTISIREKDLEDLTKEERRRYVPEMLVVDKSNILLSIE